jgi:hypothetical protein
VAIAVPVVEVVGDVVTDVVGDVVTDVVGEAELSEILPFVPSVAGSDWESVARARMRPSGVAPFVPNAGATFANATVRPSPGSDGPTPSERSEGE